MPPAGSAAEALSKDLAIQSGVIHAALEGVVTIDDRMRIVMINPAAQRMFGRTAQELLGCDLSVLIPVASREAHLAHVRQFMDSDVLERAMQGRQPIMGLRASGEEFPLEAAICQVDVSDELGSKRYYTALLRDVSREEHLRVIIDQFNRRMRSLFELLPVAIWVTEGERVVFANKACARLFGVDNRDDLTGQSIYELVDEVAHERLRQTVNKALEQQESVLQMNGLIARADGSPRDVEILMAALPDHSRTLVQMVIADITRHSQERRDLLQSQSMLRDLAASLVDAREDERRRLARELHDELGQRLTAMKLELAALERSSVPCVSPERMRSMTEMVDDTAAAVRRLSLDLRPPMLDDLGLEAAIEWLAQEFRRRTALRIDLHLDSVPDQIPTKVLTTLYRIVQEALTNIAKHAEADHVVISATLDEGLIGLVIQDDGNGFAKLERGASTDSLGLIGIHERVRMLGGSFEAGNDEGGGAKLVVKLPLFDDERVAAPDAGSAAAGAPL